MPDVAGTTHRYVWLSHPIHWYVSLSDTTHWYVWLSGTTHWYVWLSDTTYWYVCDFTIGVFLDSVLVNWWNIWVSTCRTMSVKRKKNWTCVAGIMCLWQSMETMTVRSHAQEKNSSRRLLRGKNLVWFSTLQCPPNRKGFFALWRANEIFGRDTSLG